MGRRVIPFTAEDRSHQDVGEIENIAGKDGGKTGVDCREPANPTRLKAPAFRRR